VERVCKYIRDMKLYCYDKDVNNSLGEYSSRQFSREVCAIAPQPPALDPWKDQKKKIS